jgi:hypothetical protein
MNLKSQLQFLKILCSSTMPTRWTEVVAVGHGEGAVQRGGGAEGFPVELKL